MTTRWARFIRGWIAASVSVFVALCSHVLAGGDVPSFAGIALCLAFAGMICIALAGKSLSLPRLAIAVVVSQFLFHGGFSLLGSASPQFQSHSMASGMNVQHLQLQAADSGMSMPAWMWAAHAVAAVLTILALRFGERAFWQLLLLARPFLTELFTWLVPVPSAAARFVPTRREWIPRQRVIHSTVSRRGPPALLAQ